MIEISRKKNIRFVTVERGAVQMVLAFIVQEEGGEIVKISNPRIVRIISKKTALLSGTAENSPEILLLSAPKGKAQKHEFIISPYISEFVSSLDFFISQMTRAPAGSFKLLATSY
ncbi:MAG: hypothetical protein ABI430_01705 [Candidatus Taylorbacteria bacterium]